jgi:hypothetical protein
MTRSNVVMASLVHLRLVYRVGFGRRLAAGTGCCGGSFAVRHRRDERRAPACLPTRLISTGRRWITRTGGAADLTDLLRALRSPDEQRRAEYADQFRSRALQQECLYPGAVAAVPYPIEFAR